MRDFIQGKDSNKEYDKSPKYLIREMTLQDYEGVYALWQSAEGIGLSSTDSMDSIAQYLNRNPGLSLVAFQKKQLVGAVLCGHDGRRGYIHHLAVHKPIRRRGLGRELVRRCLSALKRHGIKKCHILVFQDNIPTIHFWGEIGWSHREELVVMSKFT